MTDGNVEFERVLQKDLPRGIEGKTPEVVDARWLGEKELGPEWQYEPARLLLGYRNGKRVGLKDDRHVLTVAGSRSGKGISLIVPNLLLYPGSALVIDPKGELAQITGRQRAKLGKLVVLDPFLETGRGASGCYNPLDELDPKGREVIDEAGAIAQALVFYSGKGDPHWSAAARATVRAIILLTLTLEEKERNLVTVRQLLMLTHPIIEATAVAQKLSPEQTLLGMMEAIGGGFFGVVKGAGRALKSMAEKERESVLSEARTQTEFLDSPAVQETLKRSDFRLRDLKSEVLSVFLCLPARYMDTHERWLRVVINLAVGALEPRAREGQGGKANAAPVLLLLEEFPVLKYMEKLEAAAGQLAGSGVRLWVIVQNLGQLQRHYEQGWETFVANAGVVTCFGNSDATTLEYISKKLGRTGLKVWAPTGATPSGVAGGALSQQEQLHFEALLAPHEIEGRFGRDTGRVLVLAAGRAPLVLQRAVYFGQDGLNRQFKGLYDEVR